jgi:hypothetical protein
MWAAPAHPFCCEQLSDARAPLASPVETRLHPPRVAPSQDETDLHEEQYDQHCPESWPGASSRKDHADNRHDDQRWKLPSAIRRVRLVTFRKGLREPNGCHDRTDNGPNQHVRILDQGATNGSLRYPSRRRHQAALPSVPLIHAYDAAEAPVAHVARRGDRLALPFYGPRRARTAPQPVPSHDRYPDG